MSDYPIIFSAPMVMALLDGRKTQTRRIPTGMWRKVVPGDRLWVREAFKMGTPLMGIGLWPWYRADPQDPIMKNTKWKPAIHMPRAQSRLTLVVTAVKIERLQDISEDDAIAEGSTSKPGIFGMRHGWSMDWSRNHSDPGAIALQSARSAFGSFINELHGGRNWNLKPTNLWDQNPEVVALTFTVHKTNIDQMKDKAA